MQVFTRAGGADVSLRDVTIAQMGNGARECGWRHAPEARGGFGGFWKNQLVELRTRHRTRRVDFRGSLRPDEFARYGRRTCWEGADGKASTERLCISLPYVETFNAKVLKSFVPELRSRKCFSCFGIPMFYVYMLWTFYVRFTYSCMAMLHMNCTNNFSVLLFNIHKIKPVSLR